MEDKGTCLISAFDAAFTTNRIQMLKILFSWIPPEQQGIFAIYIKYLELQHAWRLRSLPPTVCAQNAGKLSVDFFSGDQTGTLELLDELLPYGNQAERGRIEGMKSMLSNLSRMKDMMEMMQMMKELFPEGFGGDNAADLLSGMTGMPGADMSALFSMFGKET